MSTQRNYCSRKVRKEYILRVLLGIKDAKPMLRQQSPSILFLSGNFGLSNMAYININGRITTGDEPVLQADNGSFRYGYGLFETMLVRNGTIELLPYHLERLFAGIGQLHLELPTLLKQEQLEEQVLRTVRKNKLESLCRVRLQVFSGTGGILSAEIVKAGFVIECYPIHDEITRLNENGLVVGIAEGISKSPDTLSHLKSCNALVYAMAARQARIEKWNDALVTNPQGNIIESTIANVFWVKDDIIYTPPISEGCIAGVMRRHLMREWGNVQEMPLTATELNNADEVFLTNAIRNIKWVGIIGDKKYKADKVKTLP